MKKQLFINVIFNISSFIVNLILAIILTPYLIKQIGISAYGLVPLALTFSTYIGIITQSITTSLNKNVINALNVKDYERVSEIISTAFYIFVIFVMAQLLLTLYPIYNLDRFISIPKGMNEDARWLFVYVSLSFSINIISSVLSVPMYANNRLDLIQIANIARSLSRLIITILVFKFYEVSLKSVGLGVFLSSIVSLAYTFAKSKNIAPYIKIKLSLFRKKEIKEIYTIGGWVLVNQVGFIFFSKIDLVLINIYLGSEISGLYAVIVQFSDIIKSFGGVIAGVTGPMIMILAAKDHIKDIVNLSVSFVKFLSMALAIPIVFTCVYFDKIVYVWLNISSFGYNTVVWVVMLPLIINLGVLPLFSIQVALAKVKIPALVTLILACGSVVTSIYLLKYSNMGALAVAISIAFYLTVKNAIFTPMYAASILHLKWNTFINPMLIVCFYGVLLISIYKIVFNVYQVKNYYDLVFSFTILSIVSLMLSLVFFSNDERKECVKIIKSKVSRK